MEMGAARDPLEIGIRRQQNEFVVARQAEAQFRLGEIVGSAATPHKVSVFVTRLQHRLSVLHHAGTVGYRWPIQDGEQRRSPVTRVLDGIIGTRPLGTQDERCN